MKPNVNVERLQLRAEERQRPAGALIWVPTIILDLVPWMNTARLVLSSL